MKLKKRRHPYFSFLPLPLFVPVSSSVDLPVLCPCVRVYGSLCIFVCVYFSMAFGGKDLGVPLVRGVRQTTIGEGCAAAAAGMIL